MTTLKPILVDNEIFHYNLSFDIDDFIGDGVWWLQLYDQKRRLVYDEPFASSGGRLSKNEVKRAIRDNFLTLPGETL